MLSPKALLQNGRYCVVRLLGPVHNGAVYEARDEHLGVNIALKEVFINQPEEREAFQKEVQRLARLHHPSLPTVKDQFVEGDRQYLVMEYIEGANLAEELQRQKLPFDVGQVLTYADSLLDLLAYLHSQTPPIIHQDINPHTLKLKADGQIALQHLGAVNVRNEGASNSVSWSAATVGYASPELVGGQDIDQRSDIYSLGATLYTLLTNNKPVDSQVRQQAIIHQIPDPLSSSHLNGNIPSVVGEIVISAMALDPAKRPANAKIMREMLKNKEIKEVKEMKGPKSPPLSPSDSIFAQQPERQRRRKKRRKRKKESKWPFTIQLKTYQWVVLGVTILLTIGIVIAMNYLT